ncbi:MAG: Ig-like domain-containing protein [Planctomycetota bacterium]|nr:Ig-like domain-containing protein [Planctomycetota bacterium]
MGGTGTVNGTVTVQSGGTLAPGVSPGKLNSGSVTFTSTANFDVELNGATVGTQYDQLNVTGSVTLGNATLNATLGFVPSPGVEFIIINNDGGDAVGGTFNGLAQGATITVGGIPLFVSYVGGDGNDVVLTVDNVPPTVTSIVRANANPTNAASVNFTVTFSEAVSGVGTGDFSIDAGGVSGASVTGVSGGGTTYTVTVGTGSNDGTLSIDFDADAAGGVTDTAGNVSTADFTAGAAYTIDKTPPTVASIVLADTNPTNAASVNFTVTFSESVTGVGTGDFIIDASGVTGASVTGVSGIGTTFTITVNSGSNSGTLSIDFDADADGGVTDAVGNVSAADFTTGAAYTIDKTPPMVSSIVRAGANPTNAASVNFTVTFSESVTGVGTGDFIIDASGVTGASVTGVSGIGTTFTITVNSGSNSGTLSIDFDFDSAGGATDLAGNVTTADFTTGEAYTIDKTAPAITSIVRLTPATSLTNADSLVFRATFDEAVLLVDAADFSVNGTTTVTVTNVSMFSATQFDVTVSGGNLASFNGNVGLNLASGQNITDAVGNALPNGEPATDEVYLLDNTAPTADVVDVTPDPRYTAVGVVTINFSEGVSNFDLTDLSLTRDAGGVNISGLTLVMVTAQQYTIDLATVTNQN